MNLYNFGPQWARDYEGHIFLYIIGFLVLWSLPSVIIFPLILGYGAFLIVRNAGMSAWERKPLV